MLHIGPDLSRRRLDVHVMKEFGQTLLVDAWPPDADALRVKGLAPLACKTDRIDARVLAELSRRGLVPEIWLPSPRCAPNASGPASVSTSSTTGSR